MNVDKELGRFGVSFITIDVTSVVVTTAFGTRAGAARHRLQSSCFRYISTVLPALPRCMCRRLTLFQIKDVENDEKKSSTSSGSCV